MTKNDTPANIRLNKRQRNKYLGVKSEVCGCVFDVLYVLIQRLKINKEKLNLSEFSGRYDMKANSVVAGLIEQNRFFHME